MTEQRKVEREGSGAAETSHIAADPAPARRRRLTATRKQEAVPRVLRGEDVELVARSFGATAPDCKTRSNIGPQKRLHIAVVAE